MSGTGKCGGSSGEGHGSPSDKCCRDAVELLMDYLERKLPPADQAALDEHFRACPPCLDFLASYQETPRIVRECTSVPAVPSEVKARLRRFLEQKKRER